MEKGGGGGLRVRIYGLFLLEGKATWLGAFFG